MKYATIVLLTVVCVPMCFAALLFSGMMIGLGVIFFRALSLG